jgi:hypothetical protein
MMLRASILSFYYATPTGMLARAKRHIQTFATAHLRGASSMMPHSPLPTPVVFDTVEIPRQTWEYHIETLDLREDPILPAERLTALGHEGWLLAGIFHDAAHQRLHYHFVRSV